MASHNQSKEDILQALSTDMQKGLTSDLVSERQKQYGPNKLKEKKKKSAIRRFFDQFKDVMIIILLMFYYFIMIYTVKPIVEMNKSLGDWLRYKLPFTVKAECNDELEELKTKIESVTNNAKMSK